MSEHAHPIGPVFVVGATGDVGSRVVSELITRSIPLRVLLRTDRSPGDLPATAEVARGDLLDRGSLDAALEDVSAVVTTATGYGDWKHPDARVDREGNRNLIDAAAHAGVRRVVFTSVLSAERGDTVDPFRDKYLAEQHLAASGVPFVALRAGTVIGGRHDFWARDLARGRLTAMTNADAPMSYVHVDDLARYLAHAITIPMPVQPLIDIGSEPASYRQLAAEFSSLLDREITLRAMPWPLVSTAMRVGGLLSRRTRQFRALMAFLASGTYTADPSAARGAFGETPSLRATLDHYVKTSDLGPHRTGAGSSIPPDSPLTGTPR